MPQNLKTLLEKILTKKQLDLMPSSFDTVGDILIFSEFTKELEKKEKISGTKILDNFKNIKVITKKTKKYGGTFRTPILKIMAGERRKETIHRENGIKVKLNVQNVYFSARLGHERERISKLIKKGEEVLVMFSGCGIYPVNISKNTGAKEIYAIEINPEGHRYAEENIILNKTSNIVLFNGDVNDILPKIKNKFDRVLMPLPKSAEDFLDIALKKLKPKGTLHFYDFMHENEFDLSKEKVKVAAKRANRKSRILNFTKCGQFGPGKFRVCVDTKIY